MDTSASIELGRLNVGIIEKIASSVIFLSEQPPIVREVHEDRIVSMNRREIIVIGPNGRSYLRGDEEVVYRVTDFANLKGIPGCPDVGYKEYTQQEVEELRNAQ